MYKLLQEYPQFNKLNCIKIIYIARQFINMTPELLLDPSLRYWVLIPISLVMVMVGVLRSYITILLQPSPKIQDWKVIREQ